MSENTTPGPPSRGSPKRKRSRSPDSQHGGAEEDAQLRYAYDEDLGSDAEETYHTPDGATPKKRRIERPKRLNYVPYVTLRGHKRGVASVKFSPDGRWIASCCAYMSTTCGAGMAANTSQLRMLQSKSGTLQQVPYHRLSKVILLASRQLHGVRTRKFLLQVQTTSSSVYGM